VLLQRRHEVRDELHGHDDAGANGRAYDMVGLASRSSFSDSGITSQKVSVKSNGRVCNRTEVRVGARFAGWSSGTIVKLNLLALRSLVGHEAILLRSRDSGFGIRDSTPAN
jgi:hypothetical protein